MKIYLGTDFSDERMKFMAQIGVDGVHGAPPPGPADRGYYDYNTLLQLRTKTESYGLKLYSIRLVPWSWTFKWMLGLPGRDEQIEDYRRTIRNMGAAGIPILTYNMHVLRFYRTSSDVIGRGGSRATSFSMAAAKGAPPFSTGLAADYSLVPPEHRKPVSDQQMWSNLKYFLDAVVPVAEEAGVRLALHPDDPPVPKLAGVARIMRSPEAYRKLIALNDSDANGVHFCQGCFTEMGADIPAEIKYFGSRNKIVAVDFRNVLGTVKEFREAFPDEGKADMVAAMKAYIDVGFDGPMTPDHAIHIEGDSDWGHRYWSYAVGHIRGLEQALLTEKKKGKQ